MNNTILFFDSGSGGRSILEEYCREFPGRSTAYLNDRENLPYGDKSEDFIQQRLAELVDQYITEIASPQCFVVACNTASTVALPFLRERYDFPIVGVVPAIKPAAKISETKHIALLATEATIEREYTDTLINDFASDCKVHRFASHELVHLAEKHYSGEEVSDGELIEEIAPILEKPQIDTVVLACTHFPHFKKDFQRLYPELNWVDSTEAIIRQIERILTMSN